ncbi:MAG: sensor histidine kinase [Bdellovibrio sp.]|nr:sensor histidine kinase [Bdellovibrio sp.]
MKTSRRISSKRHQSIQKKLKLEVDQGKKLRHDLKECKLHYTRLAKEFHGTKKQSAKLSELLLLQQEGERKDISRKLHDEIAQILTAVNFKLSILSRTTMNRGPELREKIIDAQQMVEKAVDKINDFARELHPMILDDLGLAVALESYIKEFMKQTKIQVKLTTLIDISELSDVNKTVLFRVAQESLTNIAKHSKASSASITIRKIKNNVQMVVRDNGISFQVKNLHLIEKDKYIGLIAMEERVKMVDGVFAITSSPGKGTLIKVQIPILRV